MRVRGLTGLLPVLLLLGAAPVDDAAGHRSDAAAVERLIADNYAYLDRFAGERAPTSAKLRDEAARVVDRRSLVRYAGRAVSALGDHHAITGASLADDWALVPSYADLWIEPANGHYVVDAVRAGSPAAAADIRAGDRLVAVDGMPTAEAVAAFWADLGLDATADRAGYAARVIAAGRRDRPRVLTVRRGRAPPRMLRIASLYAVPRGDAPPLTARAEGSQLVIRFHDSLGRDGTIAAFDAAMARAGPGQRIIIDLTDTPGGGNTTVARAVLGWFVSRPAAYQVHDLPREQRRTGIARRWIEQVLPRSGKRHRGAVTVRVGRWTGSMGEGLAIGFDAIGASVVGGRMAGLLGAIDDYRLPHSGLVVKLPTERLSAVNGTPREDFVVRGR